MRFVVGLGNPGKRYDGTRHNVGWAVLDRLVTRWNAGSPNSQFNGMVQDARVEVKDGDGTRVERVNLVKPTTFMNLSGECVQPLLRFYKSTINDMVVVMDEIDLPLGTIRLRAQGGPGGHRGLESVIQHTGSSEIKRIRVGVGRDSRIPAADWVLQPFRAEDQAEADEAIGRAADAVEQWIVSGDWNRTMNTFNASTNASTTTSNTTSNPASDAADSTDTASTN